MKSIKDMKETRDEPGLPACLLILMNNELHKLLYQCKK